MIDISLARVEKIVVHHVGNKLREEGCKLSKNSVPVTEAIENSMVKYYLSLLVKEEINYHFFQEDGVDLNEVSKCSEDIFNNSEVVVEQTTNIVKHLYSVTLHPKIPSGEVIFVLFNSIRIDEILTKALLVIKIEEKDDYLDIINVNESLKVVEKEGISLSKMQKGALIFSNDLGLSVIDKLGGEAKYWRGLFLKVRPAMNSVSCAKASKDVLNIVSKSLKNSSDSLRFKQLLKDKILDSEEVSFSDIKGVANEFVDRQKVDEIVSDLNDKFGFDLQDELEVDANYLSKAAKNIGSKIKLAVGIDLLIDKKASKIEEISIEEVGEGMRIIINIRGRGV